MTNLKPNVNWKHGYKFIGYRKDKDISIGIRNGKTMVSYFMDREAALILVKQLQEAIDDPEEQ